MLVLTRKIGQEIIINGNIRIVVVDISDNGVRVKIGIEAPRDVTILRDEIVPAGEFGSKQ